MKGGGKGKEVNTSIHPKPNIIAIAKELKMIESITSRRGYRGGRLIIA
jgi:hypothetical protein